MRDDGVLRVGYFEDSLPYAFLNRRGELVGFDVEMALQLARDLGVRAELVPVDRIVLDSGLDPAVCDLVMSGVAVTADRSVRMQFSASYLDETVAFIVPDNLDVGLLGVVERARDGTPSAWRAALRPISSRRFATS